MDSQQQQKEELNVNNPVPDGNKQSGGGASGYDANEEQQEVNKEREDMGKERPQEDLEVEEKEPKPEEKVDDK